MSKTSSHARAARTPKFRLHKATGQGFAELNAHPIWARHPVSFGLDQGDPVVRCRGRRESDKWSLVAPVLAVTARAHLARDGRYSRLGRLPDSHGLCMSPDWSPWLDTKTASGDNSCCCFEQWRAV